MTRDELRDSLARVLHPSDWRVRDELSDGVPDDAREAVVLRSREKADRALAWVAQQREAGELPDLTEAVEVASEASWEQFRATRPGMTPWSALSAKTQHHVKETMVDAVAAAAVVIAEQVRAERLFTELEVVARRLHSQWFYGDAAADLHWLRYEDEDEQMKSKFRDLARAALETDK